MFRMGGMTLRKLRPLGLRWGRWAQWWAVVRDEERKPTWRQWAQMGMLAWRHAKNPNRTVDARRAIRRAYGVCLRCPLHDLKLHTCLLCGCVQPIKLAAGGGCAAREADPNSTIGFSLPGAATEVSPALPDISPGRDGPDHPSTETGARS
jgi:hypothetical protein